MKMSMFDIGRAGYKIKMSILIPNKELIISSISKNFNCECIPTNGGFIIQNIPCNDITKVPETIYTIVRTILYDNIPLISNECIGYSQTKTEDDAVFYIENYTRMLFTCIQLSPTSYNIILV